MNIAIIGSGGREHSLCFKLNQSKKVKKIFCIPGNAGTNYIATNKAIDINNFNEIYRFVKIKKIKLIIVGPEVPLVNGIVDYFQKRKIKIFGPNKIASKLEGSKIYMKKFCREFKIPTANSKKIFNISQANKFIKSMDLPIVVKSDGLASGKGVTICKTKDQAFKDAKNILNGKFKSSKKLILEEFLDGQEMSYFVISDGYNFKCLGTAQDHKRIGEGDTGVNTGGMGAYSPSNLINRELEKKIINKIVKPTINGMKKKGSIYKGILYVGLMIKNNEPKLIEFNVRFGDPECQVLMMRLKNDILDLFISSINKKLGNKKIYWDKKPAITVVAASKGYPGKFKLNEEIKKINEIQNNKNQQLFHSGTISDHKGRIFNSGGRVLNSTVKSTSLKKARKTAIGLLNKIKWKNKYFRRDIGYRVINK